MKNPLILAGLICLVLAATASAQVFSNPDEICFNSTNYSVPGVVTSVQVQVFAPSADPVTGAFVQTTAPLLPGVAVADPATPNRYCIASSKWGITIPTGPTFVATVLVTGPGGVTRGVFSNPFTFPPAIPAPLLSAPVVVDKAPK